MKFDDIKLPDVLNQYKGLKIPFYQRRYVWENTHLERFVDDIDGVITHGNDHFMGPLILKKQDTGIKEKPSELRAVIDGQQRLTTFMILFKCLHDKFNPNGEENNTFFKNLLFSHYGDNQLILAHNHNDKEIFETIMKSSTSDNLLSKDNSAKHEHNKVFNCYKYLTGEVVRKKDWDFDKCQQLASKVYFFLVDLEGQQEDPQQIFDSLNSTGKDLSTGDLIKNALFRENEEKLYKKTWQKTFENTNDGIGEEEGYFWTKIVGAQNFKRSNLDIFLFSYLLLYHKKQELDAPKNDRLYRIESLFNNYQVIINRATKQKVKTSKTDFILGLAEAAELYRENINHEKLDEFIVPQSPIDSINIVVFGFPIIALIPYLMFILSEAKLEDRNDMILLLVNYFIRRMGVRARATDYGGTGGFTSFIRRDIRTKDSLIKALSNFGENNRFPTDEYFSKHFKEVNLNNRHSKTLLYLIEQFLHTAKDSRAPKSYSNYQLEHIMPQKWLEHWPLTNDNPDNRATRDSALRTIGNLTLLTAKLNGKLQNQGWEKKRDDGLKKHSSGMKILANNLLTNDKWDENTIVERSEFLTEQVLKLWPYPRFPEDDDNKSS